MKGEKLTDMLVTKSQFKTGPVNKRKKERKGGVEERERRKGGHVRVRLL